MISQPVAKAGICNSSVSFMQKPAEDDEGSEDSTDWGTDSESDTDSSDDEAQYASIRERFLKRSVLVLL